MNKEKHEYLLKQQKFDHIMFAMDYIRSVKDITGDISEEDYMNTLLRLYDESFNLGRQDVLDRTVYTMFSELDEIDQFQQQGD